MARRPRSASAPGRARDAAIAASGSRPRTAARLRRSRSARRGARPCARFGHRVVAHYRTRRDDNRRMASHPWPPLAITMGDACGIGPEIVARLFAAGEAADAFVVGDVAVMRRAAASIGGMLPVAAIETPADRAAVPPHCVPVLQVGGLAADLVAALLGRIDARAGAAAAACIEKAVQLVQAGEASAIVTAPIHKEALAAAGIAYPGHTEMLQALAARQGVLPPVRMMLAHDELRVVLVTIHLSLRRAIDAVTFESVLADRKS